MKAWFKLNELRSKVSIITDYFIDYIELRCVDTGLYYIIHESKVEIIK